MVGLVIVLIIVLLLVLYGFHTDAEAKEEAERKRIIEREKQAEAERVVQEEKAALIQKYGNLTNWIRWEKHRECAKIEKQMFVFAESSLLYIGGRIVLFSDIISFQITDDYRIRHGEMKAKTKTSNGSMIGRGVAGTVIAGGAGGVVGALTAKKDTTITRRDDTIIHNYLLSINIRSLESPCIRIALGQSTQIAEEINAILTYIIDSQQK